MNRARLGRQIAAFVVGLMTLTAGCAAPAAKPKVTLCYSALNMAQSILQYARDNGLFDKYGLDVDLALMEGGQTSVAALISKQAQLCLVAGAPVVNGVLAGEDLVIVGSNLGTFPHVLVAAPSIKTAADLRGKTVGVSALGGAQETSMRVALQHLGLAPDRDVTIVTTGNNAGSTSALQNGRIAAAIFSPPENSIAIRNGNRVLYDLAAEGVPFLSTGYATTRSYLSQNRALVVNLMKALSEANLMMKKDKPGAIRAAANFLKLDPEKDASALTEAYDAIVLGQMKPRLTVDPASIQAVLDAARDQNAAAGKLRPEDLFDPTIMMDVAASGLFAGLEK